MYQVTKEHIKNGFRKTSRSCPLALSIRQNLNCDVRIERQKAYIFPKETEGFTDIYFLSDEVQEWVNFFDNNLSGSVPFEFEIKNNFISIIGKEI